MQFVLFCFCFIVDMITHKLKVIVAYKVIVFRINRTYFFHAADHCIFSYFFSYVLLIKNYKLIWPALIFFSVVYTKFTAGTNFKVTSWYSEKEQPEFLPFWVLWHYILDCWLLYSLLEKLIKNGGHQTNFRSGENNLPLPPHIFKDN